MSQKLYKTTKWNIPFLTIEELQELKKEINSELWKRTKRESGY